MENSCFVKLWYLKLILQHQRSEIPTRTHGQTEGERESLDNVKINQDDFSRPTEERKNEKIQISFFVSKNEFSSKKGIRNNVKSVIKSKIFFFTFGNASIVSSVDTEFIMEGFFLIVKLCLVIAGFLRPKTKSTRWRISAILNSKFFCWVVPREQILKPPCHVSMLQWCRQS